MDGFKSQITVHNGNWWLKKQEVVQRQIAQSPCCSPPMFPVPLALLHQLSLPVHVMAALSQDAGATLLRDEQTAVCHTWLGRS